MTNDMLPGPMAASNPASDSAEQRYRRELGRATLKIGALFWLLVVVVDSIVWGIFGVDPVESLPGKLMLNSGGALLAVGLTAVLYRLRRAGMMTKVLLAFALSLVLAPFYSLLDFQIYRWCAAPEVAVFDWKTFGRTLVSSTAMYFGWACLYIALIYSFDVRDRERKLAAAREEALSAQMRALQYQVNPHFLFNTLNSIAGLIEEGDASRAEQMVLSLSSFLRTTLELDPLNDVTLADELALQQDYLQIEQERFSDRMTFSIVADDAARSALVPSLILQPLVENAVKHGVGRSAGAVDVRIEARHTERHINISVENATSGGHSPPPGFGIGLKNVAERLALRFGDAGRFASGMVSDRVFRVEIQLPWRTV